MTTKMKQLANIILMRRVSKTMHNIMDEGIINIVNKRAKPRASESDGRYNQREGGKDNDGEREQDNQQESGTASNKTNS